MDSKKPMAGGEPVTPDKKRNGEHPQTVSSPLRRRHIVKRKEGPTSTFLQSISAADIAIPTVEVEKLHKDAIMLEQVGNPVLSSDLLAPKPPSLRYTTPPPQDRIFKSWDEDVSASRHVESRAERQEYEFDYEASSQYDVGSLGSNFSEASFYSSAYASNDSCTSPESEASDFMSPLKGSQPIFNNYPSSNMSSKRLKMVDDGLWSSEMDKHLWTTFEKYSDDPTVTPYDSTCPPQGVYRRVSIQAMTTWNEGLQYGEKYGSIRLNPLSMAWPHSASITRNHLREMVKRKLKSEGHDSISGLSNTTPLTNFHRRVQRNLFTTPEEKVEDPFSTRDIAVALTTSTSESMQPDGPLAQLSRDSGSDIFGGFPQMRTGRDFLMESALQKRVQQPRRDDLHDLIKQSRRIQGFPPRRPFLPDTYSAGDQKHGNEAPTGSRTYSGSECSHHARDRGSVPQRFQSPFKGGFGRDVKPICLTQTFMEMAKKHRESGEGDPYEKYTSKRNPIYPRPEGAEGAEDMSESSPLFPLFPRSRRPMVSSDAFKSKNNPVLPLGWGSGSSARPSTADSNLLVSSSMTDFNFPIPSSTSDSNLLADPSTSDSNLPTTASSDPAEGPEPALTASTRSATGSASKRVHKHGSKSFRRQRPAGGFSYYFRDLNEKEARRKAGYVDEDTDMSEEFHSDHSSSNEE